VAKRGKDYERFVYEKFRRFFADSEVSLNDKIVGKESGLEREIDLSIKTNVGSDRLLYIVQCKDRAKRPADIVILGEFSSVIKDVGAAKGFLICTSGFAKSNHQYALTLGIELLTVEDINSDRWKADIQIPFVYVRRVINYKLAAQLIANAALVEKNRGQELTIEFDISIPTTLDNGLTAVPIKDLVQTALANLGSDPSEGVDLDLLRPNLQVEVAGVWADCGELTVSLAAGKTVYLKYISPDEYSQIQDHLRGTTIPLHVAVSGTFPMLDDTFVEVPGGEVPVFPGIYLQAEEWNQY
jgi:hypothetical protein